MAEIRNELVEIRREIRSCPLPDTYHQETEKSVRTRSRKAGREGFLEAVSRVDLKESIFESERISSRQFLDNMLFPLMS